MTFLIKWMDFNESGGKMLVMISRICLNDSRVNSIVIIVYEKYLNF